MLALQSFLHKHKTALSYGLAMGLLLLFLKWMEWRFLIISHTLELYIGAIALLFTGLGVWLALKLAKPRVQKVLVEKEVIIERRDEFRADEAAIARLGISKRELEVLQLMSEGLSNNEIAEKLFVSLNTVKTHGSNLFVKLDAKRRTQAIEKAKRLRIIA